MKAWLRPVPKVVNAATNTTAITPQITWGQSRTARPQSEAEMTCLRPERGLFLLDRRPTARAGMHRGRSRVRGRAAGMEPGRRGAGMDEPTACRDGMGAGRHEGMGTRRHTGMGTRHHIGMGT